MHFGLIWLEIEFELEFISIWFGQVESSRVESTQVKSRELGAYLNVQIIAISRLWYLLQSYFYLILFISNVYGNLR